MVSDEFIELCTILESRAKDHEEGREFALGGLSRKLTGDSIRPTSNLKSFDDILAGEHSAVSVRDIGDEEQDEEQDFRSVACHASATLRKSFMVHWEMVQAWVLIEMFLLRKRTKGTEQKHHSLLFASIPFEAKTTPLM